MTAAPKQPTINIDQLLTLSLNALDHYFFKSHKEKARKLYKEIAAGDAVEFASLTFNDAKIPPIKVKLCLDHQEYKGHLTFHMFKSALQLMMRNIAGRLQKKKDLNIFTSKETGEVIVHLPGVIQDRENINVLVLGIAPSRQTALIKLQFLDSDQFKKEVAEAQVAAESETPESDTEETAKSEG
jgi:hypothetical protein